MSPPFSAPPQVWVDAYNEFVAKADDAAPPKTITLPAVILVPEEVREILKMFAPSADV